MLLSTPTRVSHPPGGLADGEDARQQLHRLQHARRHAPEGAGRHHGRVPGGLHAGAHHHGRVGPRARRATGSSSFCPRLVSLNLIGGCFRCSDSGGAVEEAADELSAAFLDMLIVSFSEL
jgi:hypothetical protein